MKKSCITCMPCFLMHACTISGNSNSYPCYNVLCTLSRRCPPEALLPNLSSTTRFDCRIGSLPPISQVALSDTMDNRLTRQHTLLQVAQAHQHQSDSHLLVEYDPRITEYPVHSYVLFTPPVGRGNKFLPKHRGTFQVMDKTDSINTIEDLVSGKRITTHIHNLRPIR